MRIFDGNDLGNHSSDSHSVFLNNRVYRGKCCKPISTHILCSKRAAHTYIIFSSKKKSVIYKVASGHCRLQSTHSTVTNNNNNNGGLVWHSAYTQLQKLTEST